MLVPSAQGNVENCLVLLLSASHLAKFSSDIIGQSTCVCEVTGPEIAFRGKAEAAGCKENWWVVEDEVILGVGDVPAVTSY